MSASWQMNFEDWLAEMSDSHAWGDELCVVRCARLLQSWLSMLSHESLPGVLHAFNRGFACYCCTARGELACSTCLQQPNATCFFGFVAALHAWLLMLGLVQP